MEDFQDLNTYIKEYTNRIGGNRELLEMTPIDRMRGIVRSQGTENNNKIDYDSYQDAIEEYECLGAVKGDISD